MSQTDTIAAIATPAGRGGIGVIRLSGPGTVAIAHQVLGKQPPPRYAQYTLFKDAQGHTLDSGIALFFPRPDSFTGEDVLELQGHGGPVVLDMLLKRCVACGARQANPGEFTERAFRNGKLDLAQAEAVADLIESSSELAARSAQRSLQGVFSEAVHAVVEDLIKLRSFVEASIDFPEEEIDFLSDNRVLSDLDDIVKSVEELLSSSEQGRLLREGVVVTLAGKPNAGKSSLMNALARFDRAIVSEAPGTTRDTIELHMQLDGMPMKLVDTAGLRVSDDTVEREGVRRTRAALTESDHALVVVDDNVADVKDTSLEMPGSVSFTYVYNKIDLSRREPGVFNLGQRQALAVSAKTGAGIAVLRQHIKQMAGYQDTDGSTFIARSRHLHAMQRTLVHLETGRRRLVDAKAGELLAEELRLAQKAMSEITGEFSSDDLLGRIFSSFCVGK